MKIASEINDAINDYTERGGLLKEIAVDAGVSYETIIRARSGQCSLQNAFKIAKALGKDIALVEKE